MTDKQKEPTHVDDWVERFDTGKQPEGTKYARFFMFLYRTAAVFKSDWAKWFNYHQLFCTYQNKRYRCTGASRMGDVWLAKDFNRDTGYDLRVNVDDCSDWSDNPKDYVGCLSLADESYDATLTSLQEIRKVKDAKVTVSAEELACLMWKAKDTTLALDNLCKRTEWVQELFNKGEHHALPGFPADSFWGGYHVDTMKQWIHNLLGIVHAKAGEVPMTETKDV